VDKNTYKNALVVNIPKIFSSGLDFAAMIALHCGELLRITLE